MEPQEEVDIIEREASKLRRRGFQVRIGAEVVPGHSQYGKTDIIATKGNIIYCVECKFINRTNPTKKRKKVKDQAVLYASIMKYKYRKDPNRRVFAFACTNEGITCLGEMKIEESTRRKDAYFRRIRF